MVRKVIGFESHFFNFLKKKEVSSLDSPVTNAPARGLLFTVSVASKNAPFSGPF